MVTENIHTRRGHLSFAGAEGLLHVLVGAAGLAYFGSAALLATEAYLPSLPIGILIGMVLVRIASIGGEAEKGDGPIMAASLVVVLAMFWSIIWLIAGLFFKIF